MALLAKHTLFVLSVKGLLFIFFLRWSLLQDFRKDGQAGLQLSYLVV